MRLPRVRLRAMMAAVAFVAHRPARRRVASLAIYAAMAASVSIPWTVRNYRLTGTLIPTSTHGGQQLWYGSLQTGATIDSIS